MPSDQPEIAGVNKHLFFYFSKMTKSQPSVLPLTFGLSGQKLQGLKDQVGPAGDGGEPCVEGAGWTRLPRLHFVLQLRKQNANRLIRSQSRRPHEDGRGRGRGFNTVDVAQRLSALKMLSSKLKKQMAISSMTTGLLCVSSTILRNGGGAGLDETREKGDFGCASEAPDSLLLDVCQGSRRRVGQRVGHVGWSGG